jgi:hypothetical protein
MGFRTVYGYSYSENGWRMCDAAECDTMEIPGSGLRLPFRKGAANDIMRAWLSWFNRNVENLNNPGRGYTDEGSFTWTNDVGNSNHLSGTAADLNWSEHNFRVSYSGFSPVEISKCREGLRLFTYKGAQMIWWGQDWNSPKDPMHFQLNLAESNPLNREFADKLLGGYLGIFSGTPPPPVVVTPTEPGDETLLQYGSHGNQVAALQDKMNKVFPRYKAMPLAVDGDFGPKTESAVKEFQARDGQCGAVDGIVGPVTRARLAVYGIKL